jgi:hypothetical protein
MLPRRFDRDAPPSGIWSRPSSDKRPDLDRFIEVVKSVEEFWLAIVKLPMS